MKHSQLFIQRCLRFVMTITAFSLLLIACQKEQSLTGTLNEEETLSRQAEQIQLNSSSNATKEGAGLGFPADDNVAGRKANQSIVEIALSNANFSALVAAVVKTGLADALANPSASLTVFAPTNAAFSRLPAPFNSAASISAITDPAQIDFLRNVLLYHVLGAEVFANKIRNGQSSATTIKPAGSANDNTLYFSKTFNLIKVNGQTEVILPNLDATNGVVHVINDVLLFPTTTIAGVATSNTAFSALVAALVKTELVGVFTGAGNFTVFAPTDAAFAKLPAPFNSAANISAISNPGQIAALSNILRYHVLGERTFGWDFGILAKQETLANAPKNDVRTILGLPVGYVKGNANRNFSKVNAGDILCTNGVIHIIGDVLLP
jgi:uncharacterized surface protein with fasciclin (FAS1) repeats